MKKVFFLIIGFLYVSGLKTYSYDFMYNDICYNIINGSEVAVTSGDSKYTGDVTIPQQVFNKEKAYSVTRIGNSAFLYCSGLISITIPNSVTSIGEAAFQGCSGLTSITIPNSVTSIGCWAFLQCYGLISIEIPNSVTSIGEHAFDYCYGLTSITIPNSVTSIGDYAFNFCYGLTSITIPNSVTSIGNAALYGCYGLISVNVENENAKYDSRNGCNAIIETTSNTLISGCKKTIIPNSVTSIGDYAFSWCKGLTSITIPNSVTSIGSSAFYTCSGLTSITIPNSVTSIGDYAFYQCSGLSTVISEIVKPFEINEDVFESYSKLTLIVPSGTKSAYQSTAGWKRFTKIEEASSTNGEWKEVTKNFDKTIAFTKIRVKNTKTSYGTYCCAFFSTKPNDNSTADTKYNINFNRLTIGDGVEQDDSRGYIYINTCKSVGDNWYEYEFKQPVYFSHYQDNAPINQLMAFVNNGSETLSTKRTIHVATAGTLPDLISESEKYTIEELTLTGELNGTDFRLLRDMAGNNYLGEETQGKLSKLDISEAKIITGGDKYLDTKRIYNSNGSINVGSFVFSVDNNDVIPKYVFCQCKINSIRIPNSILSIEEYAFWGCRFLSSITIPNSVASIDSNAFDYCSGLTSITIPNSVTSIGSSAFYRCNGLTSITVPNTITSIEEEVFHGCSSLTSVTIPNSVTSIGYCAFTECSGLTSITIPNSVTSIGSNAFTYCSGLTSINVESGNTKYDSRNGCNAIIETESNTLIMGCKNTTIPNSVTSIGESAFSGCYGLTSITIPNSVMSIGNLAFYGCSGLTSINVESGNTKYDSRNGCNAIIETESNTLIMGCKNTTIPNSVTSIGESAFSGCYGLTSITIPNSIMSIGNYAFYGCI